MVKITFPDGSVREYEQGVTGLQIAESISPALARNVVSCGVNGVTTELNRPINEDATIALYKFEDEEGTQVFNSDLVLQLKMVFSTMYNLPTDKLFLKAISLRLNRRCLNWQKKI